RRAQRCALRQSATPLSPGPECRDYRFHRGSKSKYACLYFMKRVPDCFWPNRSRLYVRLRKRMRITLIHNPKAGDAKHGKRHLMSDLRMGRGVNATFLKQRVAVSLQITFEPRKKRKKRTKRLRSFPKSKRWLDTARCYAGCGTIIRRVNGRSSSTEKTFPGATFFGKQ